MESSTKTDNEPAKRVKTSISLDEAVLKRLKQEADRTRPKTSVSALVEAWVEERLEEVPAA